MHWDIVKFKKAIPGGIRQTHPGARALGALKHGRISHEEVTKPRAVRGSVATGNVSLCFHCSFMLSTNTESGIIIHRILEEVDCSSTRIKLLYTSEDAHHLLFACHLL